MEDDRLSAGRMLGVAGLRKGESMEETDDEGW